MLNLTLAGILESVIGTFVATILIVALGWMWRGELRRAWNREVKPRIRGGWVYVWRTIVTGGVVLGLFLLVVGSEWLKLAIESGIRIECRGGECQAADNAAILACENQALIQARARTGSLQKIDQQIAFRSYALSGWAACLTAAGYTFTNCRMTEEGCARPRTSW